MTRPFADIRVIADDYGLGSGHDAVMRRLLGTGAIDAVSVLVETCTEVSAAALRAIAASRPCIGLHLNFTYAPPGTARRPDRTLLLARSLLGLDRDLVEARIATQKARFLELFGRPPDFIDGHEHCHAFPSIRPAVLRAAAADGLPVRSMVPLRPPTGIKARVIARLGHDMQRAAERHGVRTNWRFGGVLPLPNPEAAIAALESDLAVAWQAAPTAPAEIWFMVHPGDAGDPLQIPGHPPLLRTLETKALERLRSGRRGGPVPPYFDPLRLASPGA